MKNFFHKKRYAYGSFENGNVVSLIGFSFRTERGLKSKFKRAARFGWRYDGVYAPLTEVEELPLHVKIIF